MCLFFRQVLIRHSDVPFILGGPLSFAFAMQLNKTQGHALKHADVFILIACVMTLTIIRTFLRTGHTTCVMHQEA
jgi:hypothetical protein